MRRLFGEMKWIMVFAATIFWTGCTERADDLSSVADGTVTMALTSRASAGGPDTAEAAQLKEVAAYRFEDGVLREILKLPLPDSEGLITLRPRQMRGMLYVLANGAETLTGREPVEDVTSLSEFLALPLGEKGLASDEALVMGGQTDLTGAGNGETLQVELRRSVARIDLTVPVDGVEVQSITMRGVPADGLLFPSEGVPAGVPCETVTWTRRFEEDPLPEGGGVLRYLPVASLDAPIEIEALVITEGVRHWVRTQIPALESNTVYTLRVLGMGAQAFLEAVSGNWEDADPVTPGLRRKVYVDAKASVLPEGARLGVYADTVFVPFQRNAMRLAIAGVPGLKASVDGYADGISVELESVSARGADGMQHIATAEVESAKCMPGEERGFIHLNFASDGIQEGRIVLAFDRNPLQVEGRLSFGADGICDFGTYADGTLARLKLDGDYELRLRLPEGEAPWAKLYPGDTAKEFLLEGGWKPNDPLADGRVQQAELVVYASDGSEMDAYVVKRRNWGLPVVCVNGTWWCKYNLRGNVRNFTDQVSIADDPASADGLANYLLTCSDERFLALLGDQYQGGNLQGLELRSGDNGFWYEGFASSAKDFGALDPTEMAPEGYEVPDYDDFRFFAWGHDCGLGYGSDAFNNGLGQRLSYTITERVLNVAGREYGPVNVYDFRCEADGSHWVMASLGHQWNISEGSVSPMMILMATSGRVGMTWIIEGYPAGSAQGQKSWIKYSSSNSVKSRTIRCIKSPVRYIYE